MGASLLLYAIRACISGRHTRPHVHHAQQAVAGTAASSTADAVCVLGGGGRLLTSCDYVVCTTTHMPVLMQQVHAAATGACGLVHSHSGGHSQSEAAGGVALWAARSRRHAAPGCVPEAAAQHGHTKGILVLLGGVGRHVCGRTYCCFALPGAVFGWQRCIMQLQQ